MGCVVVVGVTTPDPLPGPSPTDGGAHIHARLPDRVPTSSLAVSGELVYSDEKVYSLRGVKDREGEPFCSGLEDFEDSDEDRPVSVWAGVGGHPPRMPKDPIEGPAPPSVLVSARPRVRSEDLRRTRDPNGSLSVKTLKRTYMKVLVSITGPPKVKRSPSGAEKAVTRSDDPLGGLPTQRVLVPGLHPTCPTPLLLATTVSRGATLVQEVPSHLLQRGSRHPEGRDRG